MAKWSLVPVARSLRLIDGSVCEALWLDVDFLEEYDAYVIGDPFSAYCALVMQDECTYVHSFCLVL